MKPATVVRPKVKRQPPVGAHTEKAIAAAQPLPKKSIELIEGSKRRDVDIPER